MLYIHQHTCISPQQAFNDVNIETLKESAENKLKAIEPVYEGIPPGILRRMGKAVRMGVGAAVPLLKTNTAIDGIIIGTANGGMEDCIKFLNQIIDYDEGLLTPGNFVQSTPNAIAAQAIRRKVTSIVVFAPSTADSRQRPGLDLRHRDEDAAPVSLRQCP